MFSITGFLTTLLPGLIETAEGQFADGATKSQFVESLATDALNAATAGLGLDPGDVKNVINGLTNIIVALKNKFGWDKKPSVPIGGPVPKSPIVLATGSLKQASQATTNPQQPVAAVDPSTGSASPSSTTASSAVQVSI